MHQNNTRFSGWTDKRNDEFLSSLQEIPGKSLLYGRISGRHHDIFDMETPNGHRQGRPSGTLRRGDLWPAVGDWVLYEATDNDGQVLIHRVLSRTTCFSRRESGKRGHEQVIAANVDYVLIISALNGDFNLRRIERFATLAWDSGSQPVLVLTKADLADDPQAMADEAAGAVPGMDLLITSAVTGEGLPEMAALLQNGKTAVMAGSSGVGKSSLLNKLLGTETQKVNELRHNDHRGRHTTTSRQLFLLPGGGALIDTPGLREVGLFSDEEAVDTSFSDIAELAWQCRFGDCSHQHEPGCAVLAAVEEGELAADRYESYLKQRKEAAFYQDRSEALRKKEAWMKDIAKTVRKHYKESPKR